MKVILTQDVRGQGKKGDLIDVSDGLITIVISSSSPGSENFVWFSGMMGTFDIK